MMTIHDLKIWPCYFQAIIDGRKTFERRDSKDRDFKVGDTLRLREWSKESGYSGQMVDVIVTYILDGELSDKGVSLMSIRKVTGHTETYECHHCGDDIEPCKLIIPDYADYPISCPWDTKERPEWVLVEADSLKEESGN